MYKMNNQLEYQIKVATMQDLKKINWSNVDLKHSYYVDKWGQKLDGKLEFYVATVGEFPISHVILDWTKYADNKIGDISSLTVFEIFRGQGIGTKIIGEMENILKLKGCEISQTGAVLSNKGALKLYKRLGYTITGEKFGTSANPNTGEAFQEMCYTMQKVL